MSGPELKPCPFCGADAHMLGGPMAQEAYSVWCKAKGRRHHIDGTMDAHQTAAIWNTRADLPPTLASALALPEIAAMEKLLHMMDLAIQNSETNLHGDLVFRMDDGWHTVASLRHSIRAALAALDAAKVAK